MSEKNDNNDLNILEDASIGETPSPAPETGVTPQRELSLFDDESELERELSERAAKRERAKNTLVGVICGLAGMLLGIVLTLIVVDRVVANKGDAPMEGLTRLRTIKNMGQYDSSLFSELLMRIDTLHFGDTPTTEELTNAAAHAMVDSVGDRYAAYFSNEEYNEYTSSMNGNYKRGVGISVYAPGDDGALIHRVFECTFADEAGLKGGDIILALDGVSVIGLTMDEMTDLIAGDAGTTVDFTVKRGDETLTMPVMRGDVYITRVEYFMLEGGVGYLHVVSFTGDAENEFKAAIGALEAEGAASLIIDLRDNPGGSLTTVVNMCDYMLPECTIASMSGKTTDPTEYFTSDADMCELPFVVLVNGDSASASEIFAGAMQDNGRAAIIGTRTFGKGIVQTTFTLRDGHGYLKLTTDAYFTPNGTSLSGTGITPDVVVELPEELQYADVYTLYTDYLNSDTQLLAAIDYLKANN